MRDRLIEIVLAELAGLGDNASVSAQFNVPATVICGGGAIAELTPQLKRLRVTRVLLVTDDFMVRSGLVSRVEAELRGVDIAVATFAGVQPDPTEENVLAGLAQFHAEGAEAIVALGGGSPIDCGKAISLLSANPAPLSLYLGRHK
ncbi:MAG: iron-containing alcohol dehydrogenase, partial [Opitutaceae bacterium]